MMFSEYLKNHIKIISLGICKIHLNVLCCQYNPDRIKIWRAYSYDGSLLLTHSPHVNFLQQYQSFSEKKLLSCFKYEDTTYYKLQKKYGKSNKTIQNKIRCFIKMYEHYDSDAPLPQVLVRPIVKNEYNSGMEIWEGHHRLACNIAKNNSDCLINICDWKEI